MHCSASSSEIRHRAFTLSCSLVHVCTLPFAIHSHACIPCIDWRYILRYSFDAPQSVWSVRCVYMLAGERSRSSVGGKLASPRTSSRASVLQKSTTAPSPDKILDKSAGAERPADKAAGREGCDGSGKPAGAKGGAGASVNKGACGSSSRQSATVSCRPRAEKEGGGKVGGSRRTHIDYTSFVSGVQCHSPTTSTTAPTPLSPRGGGRETSCPPAAADKERRSKSSQVKSSQVKSSRG